MSTVTMPKGNAPGAVATTSHSVKVMFLPGGGFRLTRKPTGFEDLPLELFNHIAAPIVAGICANNPWARRSFIANKVLAQFRFHDGIARAAMEEVKHIYQVYVQAQDLRSVEISYEIPYEANDVLILKHIVSVNRSYTGNVPFGQRMWRNFHLLLPIGMNTGNDYVHADFEHSVRTLQDFHVLFPGMYSLKLEIDWCWPFTPRGPASTPEDQDLNRFLLVFRFMLKSFLLLPAAKKVLVLPCWEPSRGRYKRTLHFEGDDLVEHLNTACADQLIPYYPDIDEWVREVLTPWNSHGAA